jgi:hypothetical protein
MIISSIVTCSNDISKQIVHLVLINNHALNVIVHAVCHVVYLPLFEEPIWIALLLLNIK